MSINATRLIEFVDDISPKGEVAVTQFNNWVKAKGFTIVDVMAVPVRIEEYTDVISIIVRYLIK